MMKCCEAGQIISPAETLLKVSFKDNVPTETSFVLSRVLHG